MGFLFYDERGFFCDKRNRCGTGTSYISCLDTSGGWGYLRSKAAQRNLCPAHANPHQKYRCAEHHSWERGGVGDGRSWTVPQGTVSARPRSTRPQQGAAREAGIMSDTKRKKLEAIFAKLQKLLPHLGNAN